MTVPPSAPVPVGGEPARATSDEARLSARVIVVGAALGLLLAVSNLYMGLKTGWNDSGNITASVLGFAVLSVWARAIGERTRPGETNLMQTIATSAGGVVGTSGVIGAIPALAMLGHSYSTTSVILWAVALSLLGTLLAWSLRGRLLADEKLPFPTSIATAEVIEGMHRAGTEGTSRARSLSLAGLAAMVVTWFRDGKPAIIPQATLLPGKLVGTPAAALTLGVSWSPMMLGAGMLIGPNLGASVFVGAAVAWGVIAPRLVAAGIVTSADYGSLIQWLLWPGLALMLSSAFTALLLDRRTFVRAIRSFFWRRGDEDSHQDRLGGALLPLWAVALAATGLVGWLVFGLHPLLVLIAIVLALVLGNVAVRAAGETDVNPMGVMGTVTQISTGLAARGSVVTPLAAGGLVCGVASHAGDAIWALKAGQLLRTDARRQLVALLVGIAVGAAVVVPGYHLLDGAYRVGSQRLPSPGALSWKATAEAVAGGRAALPHGAGDAAAVAAVLGVALTLLAKTRRKAFVPSPVAIGVGVFVPAFYGVTIFAGALVAALFRWRRPRLFERHGASIAAGAIAGESLIGVLVAVLILLGVVGS